MTFEQTLDFILELLPRISVLCVLGLVTVTVTHSESPYYAFASCMLHAASIDFYAATDKVDTA